MLNIRSQSQNLIRTRSFPLGLLLGGLLVITAIFALSQGSVALSFSDLSAAFLRQGNPVFQTIVWDLRIPRVLARLLVGAALGMSGAILQGMLRNSLADSFVLEISSGAGLAAVLLLTIGGVQLWVPVEAWVGAMIAAAIVYAIGLTGGVQTSERLILSGIAISALFGSMQTLLLLFASENRVQAVLNWLIGSLNGRGWEEVRLVAPYVCVAFLLGLLLSKQLNLLNLGDELATSMGLSVMRSQLFLGAIASLLAAGAVTALLGSPIFVFLIYRRSKGATS